jgi:cysteine desulfurase
MPGVNSALQVMRFDLKGISLSAGSACSSGKVKPSHVLKAMGVPEPALNENIRVSLGLTTTSEDIGYFISVWKEIYTETKGRSGFPILPSVTI